MDAVRRKIEQIIDQIDARGDQLKATKAASASSHTAGLSVWAEATGRAISAFLAH
jgi:hypothetical protein